MDFKNIEFLYNLNEKELNELTKKFINDYKQLLDITLTEEENNKIIKNVDEVLYNELILETLKKLRDNDEKLKENYIFNKVNKKYLRDENVFIEQFINDVRFNSEIHIYKDMVISEYEHKVFKFNYLFDYSKQKYDNYKDELDQYQYILQKDLNNSPTTKEAKFYRKIFLQKFGLSKDGIIPHYWQPKWDNDGLVTDYVDPSARKLEVYE